MAKKSKNSKLLVHYTRTMTPENLSRAANYVGGYVLKGLGALGKIFTAPLTGGPMGTNTVPLYPRTVLLANAERKLREAQEELIGKAMTWISPLNYGAALATGNGLNARKGEEEVASWSPAWQAAARLGELYVGPKAVKGVKSAPRAVVNTVAKAGVKPAKAAVVAREINNATKKGVQNLEKIQPEVRTRYGDVEIDNPQLAYRLGNGIAKDFLKIGKVRTPELEGYGDIIVDDPKLGRFNFGKDFDEPMFALGRLWYGLPRTNTGDLLVTAEPLALANKYSSRIKSSTNGTFDVRYAGFDNGKIRSRRVQNYEGLLTPENTTAYKWVPGYGYRKVIQEPSTSLKFFERGPAKNNIVGASYDYRMEDPKGSMDFLKQFFALLKINGKEYTLEGLRDAANVQQGLPEHIQSYLNLNTVERAVRAMRKNGYSEREIQLYIDKVNEEMNKVKVGMYSDLEYNAAGALDFGGFYNKESNFISVNRDAHLKDSKFTPEYIMKHEGRHLIDYNTSMTDDVINILEKAYDKDFLEIPKHEDAGSLKDYQHMDRERVTTNRDARDVLLTSKGKYLLNKHDFIIDSSKRGYSTDMIDFLNKIIKYALPEDIVNAVENSNGYGKRYINYLKKNNKLTPAKIEQLRLAMIHVPSYLLPVAGGYTLYNLFNQPLQQLQYLKHGGKMNVIELFKKGGYIRKMQTAAGGPITRYETLPNIEVVGYRPIELKTYKPLHKDYPFTGHSSLDIPIDEDNAYTQGWYSPYGISVDKTANSKDYNLITNNCADATLGALNYIFGTKEKPLLFTTPGDVRDYAINKLHGKVTRDKDGIDTILIPRNKNNAKKISKKALEWAKNKDENTIYEFEYKQGGKMNILEFLKKGSGIHIKKKNKGSFTRWCGGNVTDECILRGKNSSNPKIRKKATFADNARHFKHKSGGLIVQKFQEAGKLPNQQGGTVLPEITVVPTRLSLSTYYPIIGENYRYTGHSSLRARSPEYTIDTSEGFKTIPANSAIINKRSSDAGYNFITNNCSDATRCALEAITGKKMNPYFFTTPGDVLDFFKENFDDVRKVKSKNSGKEVYYTNITPKQLEIIKEQLLEQILKNRIERRKGLLANARKWKHKNGGCFSLLENIVRKHQTGGKTSFGLKAGNFLNSLAGLAVISGVTSLISTAVLNKKVQANAEAQKALNQADWAETMKLIIKLNLLKKEQKYQQWISDYLSGRTMDQPSLIVAEHEGNELLNLELAEGKQGLANKNKQIDAQASAETSGNWGNAIGGIILNGLGVAGNYLANKGTNNITTSTTGNSIYKLDSFWTNPTLKTSTPTYSFNTTLTPPKTNYSFLNK